MRQARPRTKSIGRTGKAGHEQSHPSPSEPPCPLQSEPQEYDASESSSTVSASSSPVSAPSSRLLRRSGRKVSGALTGVVSATASSISTPAIKRLTWTSAWALRVLRWRRRARQVSESARESLSHLSYLAPILKPLARLPFGASPFQGALAALGVATPDGSAVRQSANDGSYTPPITPQARIIANPTAGSIHFAALHDLRQTAEWLTAQGLPTELRLTQRPGHARELAAEAVEAGQKLVVAAGGDGTLNDVIQSLAGQTAALGVLPMGTVNVWAREMNIPLSLHEARKVLLHGVRRRVDLGRAGTRYFLMMAGVGFDAEVARRVEQGMLKRIGLKMLDYLTTVGILSVTHRAASIRIRLHGDRRAISALMVIIGNTRLYGGAMTFTERAVADDGKLDVLIVRNGGLAHRLNVLARALLRRPAQGPRVRYERAQRVRIEANVRVPVQVDGDVIGFLPMTFESVPQALTVLVPQAAPEDLFSLAPLPGN